MLSRRSLVGSLVKSLLAAGVIAAPSAAVVVPSEAEAQPTPSPGPGGEVALHRGGARVNIFGDRRGEGAEAARLDAASGRGGGRCGIRRIHTDLLWIVEFTRDIAGAAYSHAFGAHTVLFTTSPSKFTDAKRLGADEVVISKNPGEMAAHANSFDFILDTIAGPHKVSRYLDLLKRDGILVQVGAPEKPMAVEIFSLIFKRRNFAGSLIGGIKETQEMLDFCAEHNITADVEVIPIQKINEAYERMLRSDVKYRFSIDMSSLSRAA
jgi:Zinc-binding dehydrogenase